MEKQHRDPWDAEIGEYVARDGDHNWELLHDIDADGRHVARTLSGRVFVFVPALDCWQRVADEEQRA